MIDFVIYANTSRIYLQIFPSKNTLFKYEVSNIMELKYNNPNIMKWKYTCACEYTEKICDLLNHRYFCKNII